MSGDYQGIRVAITGGSGFIGARLILALRKAGAMLSRIDRDRADMRDANAMGAAIHDAAPEIVFHLAAGGVADLFADQPGQIEANVLGTLNVLDAARRAGVRRVVAFGTCFEYAPSSEPLSEDSPLSPRNPYAVSKMAAFAAARHAADVLSQDIVWLRPFAVYGPGQPTAKLIPSLIHAGRTGTALPLGDGRSAWDYVHADDVASAAIVLGLHPDAARGVFNAGSGEAHTARAIATEIARLTGRTAPPLAWGARPARPGDPAYMCADTRRLRRLGWTPPRALRAGLAELLAGEAIAA